jgi:GT2 family glycosyltransferase/tetratricopeptide (TPR) repeat protein
LSLGGAITFGSLHQLEKLNDTVLDLWCRILQAVPSARLLVVRHLLQNRGRPLDFGRGTSCLGVCFVSPEVSMSDNLHPSWTATVVASALARPELDGDALVSLLILCCDEVEYTRLCLESVWRHTQPPYELILVDNGSHDDTPALLAQVQRRPGPIRVEVLRNPSNLGFAKGCNQALAQARGRYLVFLNNDTVVTAGWLERLLAWAQHDWPTVGLVGPLSNYATPPQQVAVPYTDGPGLDAFAAQRRQRYLGQAVQVPRLSGFCLLARRELLERIGGFDERYGIGFFEDDDLGWRAQDAGFRLLLALDVFVHHFGSRTFAGLGLDTTAHLQANFELFHAKWGSERSAGYHLPDAAGGLETPGWKIEEGGWRIEPRPPVSQGHQADSPSAARPRVSACLIVKNEEANLPACLESVADLVDEIIVVDTGSSDATKEVAARFSAQVFDFPWVDSFAAARNESLRHATGDWIFWLDADDRIDEANRRRLRALFDQLGDENLAYVMKCLCLPEPGRETGTVVDHVRLFRNHPAIRWEYRVHEQILPAVRQCGGDVRWTEVVIHHTGYQDPALRQRKLQRDLRLLQLDHAEHPEDPFILFNLGQIYQELGQPAEGAAFLRRSLERSHSSDSIVRKLYALLAQCHQQLKQPAQALAVCRTGRGYYPDDVELLFLEGLLLRRLGDRAGAKACLEQLVQVPPGNHFASVDAGLRSYKARHNLAVLCQEQGQLREAEEHWQQVLADQPGFLPAWLGLADLYLTQARWSELDAIAEQLQTLQGRSVEAVVIRARGCLARREFARARQLLEEILPQAPEALWPRVILSHVLLQEGKDWPAAEQALRKVLALDPENTEARHNLAVFLQQQGRPVAQELGGKPVLVETN